uniref:MADF domain-containing protein n=1 Tax=Haemonchus contortus TaxID=6289 RepID=A0A7I4XW05_HAECO
MSASPNGMDMDVWIAELISKVSGFIDDKDKLRLRLIELVEKEKCIWDRRNGDFELRFPRGNAWRRITSIMREEGYNVTMAKLKTIWRALRVRWKKLRTCTTEAKTTWRFFEAIKFLELNELTDNEEITGCSDLIHGTSSTTKGCEEERKPNELTDETASCSSSIHSTFFIPKEHEEASEANEFTEETASCSGSIDSTFFIPKEHVEKSDETTGFMREEVADIDVVGTSMKEDVNTEDKYDYFGKLVTSVLRDYDKKVNEKFAMSKMEAIFSIIMSRDWAHRPQNHCRSRDASQQCVPSPCRCIGVICKKEVWTNKLP